LAWTIEYHPEVRNDFRKIDRQVQRDVLDYLDERIAKAKDPRDYGKPLGRDKHGLWKYRVGAYRIICRFLEEKLVVLVVIVGHRSTVYDIQREV
jgi:mRNA interferase RelE/StbE